MDLSITNWDGNPGLNFRKKCNNKKKSNSNLLIQQRRKNILFFNVQVSEKRFFDSVFYLDPHQNVLGLFWTKVHPPSECHGNQFIDLMYSCWQTNQPSKGQRWKHELLGRANKAKTDKWILPDLKVVLGSPRRPLQVFSLGVRLRVLRFVY